MQIRGISSMAMRHVLAELAPRYERRSGSRVSIESVGGVDAAHRVEAGEAFDFVVLARQAIDKLADGGCVDPDTRIDLARSGVGIAVRAGARRPSMDSVAGVRDAVAAARCVAYSTGPSGRHLARLFERWGIAPRAIEAPPGVPVGALVASGEAEIGFQQVCELVGVAGVDLVGALPPEIQEITVFSGAVTAVSPRHADASALLRFLASVETAGVKRGYGMEPSSLA